MPSTATALISPTRTRTLVPHLNRACRSCKVHFLNHTGENSVSGDPLDDIDDGFDIILHRYCECYVHFTRKYRTPFPFRISACSVAYCSGGSICLSKANICWNVCCPEPAGFVMGEAVVTGKADDPIGAFGLEVVTAPF